MSKLSALQQHTSTIYDSPSPAFTNHLVLDVLLAFNSKTKRNFLPGHSSLPLLYLTLFNSHTASNPNSIRPRPRGNKFQHNLNHSTFFQKIFFKEFLVLLRDMIFYSIVDIFHLERWFWWYDIIGKLNENERKNKSETIENSKGVSLSTNCVETQADMVVRVPRDRATHFTCFLRAGLERRRYPYIP